MPIIGQREKFWPLTTGLWEHHETLRELDREKEKMSQVLEAKQMARKGTKAARKKGKSSAKKETGMTGEGVGGPHLHWANTGKNIE